MNEHVRTAIGAARAGIGILLLLILFFVCAPWLLSAFSGGQEESHILAAGVGAFIVLRLWWWSRKRLTTQALAAWFDETSQALIRWVEQSSPATQRLAILTMAGLTLFLELSLIRWQAGLFAVFALYKNFTLLACFCGLGIGYALSRRAPLLLPLSLPMLAAALLLLAVLRYGTVETLINFLYIVPAQEASVMTVQYGPGDFFSQLEVSIPVYLLLIGTFLLNAMAMLPAAQFCGYLMEQGKPLVNYGYNLLGSIAGVVLIFLLSSLWAGPVVWFGSTALLLLWYQSQAQVARKAGYIAAGLCVMVAAWPSEPLMQDIYSPYQLIQKTTQPDGLMQILAAGAYYQKVHNLALNNGFRESDPQLKRMAGYYDLPFKVAPTLKHVAIVGAGSGNDAAAALRAGALSVDAVEIDPVIRDLGKQNHPEHPYNDDRVHSVINDARTFFRNSHDKYDAIVYGVLDSHVLLSHGSNVRVDSFVYTQQGFQDAYDHLEQGGMMSVAFALVNDIMGHKIYRMLKNLPGAGEPLAIGTDPKGKGTTFIVRKGAEITLPQDFMAHYNQTNDTAKYAKSDQKLDLPTDDWPFFYMDSRMYPATYVFSLVMILALSAVLVLRFLPGQRWQLSLMPFFFLGGGFMLVETKAITELGLIFGNTWQVVGVTIISVLVMAYCANWLAARLSVKWLKPAFAMLLAVIALGYYVATSGGIGHSDIASKLGMLVLLTCPLLFSGIVFSTLLNATGHIGDAMAYNLMGAMLGGVLEYNSMQFGFAFLYLIALVLYALALLTARRPA